MSQPPVLGVSSMALNLAVKVSFGGTYRQSLGKHKERLLIDMQNKAHLICYQ